MFLAKRTTVTAIASAILILGATATTAGATSTTIKDKNSDVQYYKGFDDQSPTTLNHDLSIRSGVDVRGFKLNASKTLVSVHFDVVHLQDEDLTATVELQKNKLTQAGSWRASFRVHTDPNPSGTVHSGEVRVLGELRCTVDVQILPGRYATIHARIPRSCIDNPKTIRAKASLSRYFKPVGDEAEESEHERTWSDPVSATYVRSQSWTKWIAPS